MERSRVKPLDGGTGRVCASFDPTSAAWLSVGLPHDRKGFIELSDTAPFDERRRGAADATRTHRLGLSDPKRPLLVVELDGQQPRLEPVTDDPRAPAWHGDGIRVATRVEPDASDISQAWEIERGALVTVTVRLRGRLDRPALAEITETDPPEPTGAETARHVDGRAVDLEAMALPARARVVITGTEAAWDVDGPDGLVATLRPEAGAGRTAWTITIGFPGAPDAGRGTPLPRPVSGDPLIDRALAYVRGCTALRVGRAERVILTDHRLLPLSWTRDGYWQALALLAADAPGDRERVADHLRWLWRRCERPERWWARSHHANGLRKDLAFQADQQLYPLLELADYHDTTGSLPAGVDWPAEVTTLWQALGTRIDARLGLLESGENAADDPAAAPFIAASQILRWRAARRLEALARAGALAVDPATFATAAQATRSAFAAAFERGDRPWPYAVDRDGVGEAYHDANDLPVAMAPAWGFCAADDPGWRATMDFAFSPANPGWVAGTRAGLGSAHTPGVWTLGDLQAWIHARATGDEPAVREAIARLRASALADGMLPEACDPDDGTPIRLWFAWPGAAFAALSLADRR